MPWDLLRKPYATRPARKLYVTLISIESTHAQQTTQSRTNCLDVVIDRSFSLKDPNYICHHNWPPFLLRRFGRCASKMQRRHSLHPAQRALLEAIGVGCMNDMGARPNEDPWLSSSFCSFFSHISGATKSLRHMTSLSYRWIVCKCFGVRSSASQFQHSTKCALTVETIPANKQKPLQTICADLSGC